MEITDLTRLKPCEDKFKLIPNPNLPIILDHARVVLGFVVNILSNMKIRHQSQNRGGAAWQPWHPFASVSYANTMLTFAKKRIVEIEIGEANFTSWTLGLFTEAHGILKQVRDEAELMEANAELKKVVASLERLEKGPLKGLPKI